ncbi:metallophosphoesterase [Arthrobacter sp. NPDC056691]|uniref:metallophosphoesterase n=1 Tax=Arthrobacter sp. NPDC056691 TaxID=3345913 RepID=UPI00366E45D3
MTGPSKQRGWAGLIRAAVLGLALLLTGCQPGPPAPPPSSGAPVSPGTSRPPATPEPSSPAVPSPPGTSSPTRPSPAEPSASPEPGSVHFTAQGDIGLSTGAWDVLDTIRGLRPELNLALGDFSYEAGREQDFCDMVTGKLGGGFAYQVVTGNHESDGHDGDIANIVNCLPNRLSGLQGEYGIQWYADYPERNPLVRFIMVSPGIEFHDGNTLDYSRGSERWQWTAAALDGAKSKHIPWTVVGMHTPCLSVGKYGCQAGRDFTNLLIDKKADLVLTGHDHIYQRSHQLGAGQGCPALVPDTFSGGCLADSNGPMVQGAGTVFATVGTGGVGLYEVHDQDPEAPYFATWSGKNRDAALGTLDVTATADRLSARFVPAAGYSFTDTFEIGRK